MTDTREMDEVIRRARDGDPDALAQLWRAYNHLLLRYFRGKRMRDPDDLASTVWVEVATSLGRFQGGEHDFRRWLFTIAARRRIDDIRAIKRREAQTMRSRPAVPALQSPSAGDEADRNRSLDIALDLIATLPDDQADAVLLRVIGDLSVSEVAAIMRRREGTVRVLVHRGLKRLAEHTAVTEQRRRTMSQP